MSTDAALDGELPRVLESIARSFDGYDDAAAEAIVEAATRIRALVARVREAEAKVVDLEAGLRDLLAGFSHGRWSDDTVTVKFTSERVVAARALLSPEGTK